MVKRLLIALKPLICAAAMLLLVGGMGCVLVGLGAKYYGHIGDPDHGFLELAATGVACVVAAIVLDRAAAMIDDAPADLRRGFPVEFSGGAVEASERGDAGREPEDV